MKKQNSLKEIRNINNLTQNELSKLSGISIRTIQRMEKGLSTGSPYTIKTLAKALNIESTALLFASENISTTSDDGLSKVKLMNFSILSVFLIPFGNIILPTIIFLFNRKNEKVNNLGRKIISFQVVITPILFFLTIIIFLIVGRGGGSIPLPVFICYVMYVLFNMVIVIRTALDIDRKKEVPNFFPNFM